MIELTPTLKEISEAHNRAALVPPLDHSIEEQQGKVIGYIGALVVARYFLGTLGDTYHYDVIVSRLRVEVKTAKTTVTPRLFYNCNVCYHNATQQADYYYFTRIHEDFDRIWLLGSIPAPLFRKIAIEHLKGTPDPEKPSWKFKETCYSVQVHQLTPLTIPGSPI